ncbi:hypothetical protein DEI87_10990 [Curtobacterium sp. MCBD17_029]|nr:hypothetical protein DEI87_10990 [Curtobacterium sp. MCBD17_029]PYY59710.1 hypothetical protein DEJ26_07335 [Curtobacterium sp. MCPF17_015]
MNLERIGSEGFFGLPVDVAHVVEFRVQACFDVPDYLFEAFVYLRADNLQVLMNRGEVSARVVSDSP